MTLFHGGTKLPAWPKLTVSLGDRHGEAQQNAAGQLRENPVPERANDLNERQGRNSRRPDMWHTGAHTAMYILGSAGK